MTLVRQTVGALKGLLAQSRKSVDNIKNKALIVTAKADHQRIAHRFKEQTAAQGYGDLSRYYWYHTIDLGNGLVTPGDYDYRSSLPLFQFPEDMRGMTVLDVGSATGFFAFEFEKRGAIVTSVELPSIADWDMLPGEDKELALKGLMDYHRVTTVEEVQHFHLDGPFEFCRKILKSNVRRCHSTVYDLSPQKVGAEQFDLVFVGDVLLHTLAPFKALATIAQLCGGTLILAQGLSEAAESYPVLEYAGGESPHGDNRTWFHPNKMCVERMLKRLRFKTVREVGRHTGVERRGWWVYTRSIFHATR